VVKGWSKLGLVGRGVASPIFARIFARMCMHGSDIIRHSYDDDESMSPRMDWRIVTPVTR
jgi:hypothetical protein